MTYTKFFSMLLLTTTISMAFSAKTKHPEIVTGSTIGKYKKPGAPVDIRYQTQHVLPGETGQVTIDLITPEKQGDMVVKLQFDPAVTPVGTLPLTYHITLNGASTYPLAFQVVSNTDGVHYIRLFVTMGRKGFRVFSVPFYVGNGTIKLQRKPLQKGKNGTPISVSKVQETISNAP